MTPDEAQVMALSVPKRDVLGLYLRAEDLSAYLNRVTDTWVEQHFVLLLYEGNDTPSVRNRLRRAFSYFTDVRRLWLRLYGYMPSSPEYEALMSFQLEAFAINDSDVRFFLLERFVGYPVITEMLRAHEICAQAFAQLESDPENGRILHVEALPRITRARYNCDDPELAPTFTQIWTELYTQVCTGEAACVTRGC